MSKLDALNDAGRALLNGDNVLVRPPRGFYANGTVGVPIPERLPIRITTTTPRMRDDMQGNGYIDPKTNLWTQPDANTVMSPDHKVPVSEIVRMRGFNTLTRQQMTSIIQDRDGNLGNIQAMPKSLNESKGNRIQGGPNGTWNTAHGEPVHPDYTKALGKVQNDIRRRVEQEIQRFQHENNSKP